MCNFTGHVGSVYVMSWSVDSQYLISASQDSTIKLWDIKTRKLMMDLPGHADQIYTLDWSGDGRLVASGGKDRQVKLWTHWSYHLFLIYLWKNCSIFFVQIWLTLINKRYMGIPRFYRWYFFINSGLNNAILSFVWISRILIKLFLLSIIFILTSMLSFIAAFVYIAS